MKYHTSNPRKLKVLITVLVYSLILSGCSSKLIEIPGDKETISCGGYKIKRVNSLTDLVKIEVKAYDCNDRQPYNKGFIVVKDSNDKNVLRQDINNTGVTAIELKPGNYKILTNLGPERTPLVLFEKGSYKVTFLIGPDDVSVD